MPSKDSIQQQLRSHKRQWNSSYKEFSQKLKAFKNGINGKGDAKAGIHPSDIKFPLPNEIGSFLDGLSSDFQHLVGEAHAIMTEQNNYSRNRKKKKQKSEIGKLPEALTPAPENDKIVDTLSRLGSVELILHKEASNRITRFWQYFTSIFSTKEYNKHRISLLSHTAEFYYNLLDFENDILSLSKISLRKSITRFITLEYTFNTLKKSIDNLVGMMEQKSKPSDVKPEKTDVKVQEQDPRAIGRSPINVSARIEKVREDIHLLINSGLNPAMVEHMSVLIHDYDLEKDAITKSLLGDRLVSAHKEMLRGISEEAQKKYGPVQIKSLQDIINLVKKNKSKKATLANSELIKIAHNSLTRYLKKKLVQSLGYDKTAAHRLEIVDRLFEMKKTSKRMMDSLESGIDIESLKLFIGEIEENIDSTNKTMDILGTIYTEEFYNTNLKQKKKNLNKDQDDTILDTLLTRKVKRDLSRNIF